jgi:hypothetical protein
MTKTDFAGKMCAICGKSLDGAPFGPIVVAEVVEDKPTSFAHGKCWVDSGREMRQPSADIAHEWRGPMDDETGKVN